MRGCVTAAVAIALLCGSAALPAVAVGQSEASASSFRACRSQGVYPPKDGGYGLIISRIHVQRVSCDRAVDIGGAYMAGDPVASGWRCQVSSSSGWTSCRYKHSGRKFRFILEGNAG